MGKRRRGSKRERSHDGPDSDHFPASLAKRLRRPSPAAVPAQVVPIDVVDVGDDENSPLFRSPSSRSPVVMATGLPSDCTVLELKSRLEMYGPISRTRIDAADGAGYVTFRSSASADAAISASLDPAAGVVIRSHKVIVCRAADPLLVWKTSAGTTATSKLLRGETSLSKHGRSPKKLTAGDTGAKAVSDVPYKGREIIAYDDLF